MQKTPAKHGTIADLFIKAESEAVRAYQERHADKPTLAFYAESFQAAAERERDDFPRFSAVIFSRMRLTELLLQKAQAMGTGGEVFDSRSAAALITQLNILSRTALQMAEAYRGQFPDAHTNKLTELFRVAVAAEKEALLVLIEPMEMTNELVYRPADTMAKINEYRSNPQMGQSN